MSKHRGPRITRTQAEKLLDTGSGESDALSALLAAAAAPATAGELAGEDIALAEYRAANLTTVSSRRRQSMLKTALANLFAAKVAALAAVAAAATGGVALAAATGNLPGMHSGSANPAAAISSSNAGAAESDEPSAPSTEASESSPAEEPSGSEAPGTATPSPSLTGLCKAFQAGATSNPGKALANPAFSVLVSAAGGTDKVADFCVTLVGPAPTHPGRSSHPGAPSTHPGAPSTHPGAPSTHPGRSSHPGPSSHPTGAPTSLPGGRP